MQSCFIDIKNYVFRESCSSLHQGEVQPDTKLVSEAQYQAVPRSDEGL